MLIITSDFSDLPERAAHLAAWPGPHLLALHPGHGLSPSTLDELEKTFVLYDLADRETCMLSMIRTILLHADARGWSITGPFLFASHNQTDEQITALAAHAQANLGTMRFEGAADEGAIAAGETDLTLLLLGAEVSENPLIMTFFRNMEPDLAPEHTRTSLNLLQEHLV
ncbi:MAG: hypothetical protein ACPGFA_02345 [Pikeienuella sp.]